MKTRNVKFTRLRSEISLDQFDEIEEDKNKSIELTGRLTASDNNNSSIRLNVENEGRYLITVPDGLNDIVKKYWKKMLKLKELK